MEGDQRISIKDHIPDKRRWKWINKTRSELQFSNEEQKEKLECHC